MSTKRPAQKVQWEYHDEDFDGEPSWPQAMQRIRNLGEDGWELVAITTGSKVAQVNGSCGPDRMMIFKRQARYA